MGVRTEVGRHISSTFGSGLLVMVPLGLTYMVLKFLFDILDGLLEPAIHAAWSRVAPPGWEGMRFPGVGLVALIVLVYLAGMLTLHGLGRGLLRLWTAALLKIPVVGTVYSTAKQLIDSFAGTGTTGFKRVVLIEYPRKDCWTVGFLTGTTKDAQGAEFAFVYIPTAPTPNSGWVAMVPLQDVRDTDLSVRQALRLVLSGGITAPEMITWSKQG